MEISPGVDHVRDSMLDKFKSEFQWKNFGLSHEAPHLFVTPKFGPIILYQIWTFVWSLYHIAFLCYAPYEDSQKRDYTSAIWLVYLTNWSYLLLVVMVVTDFTCAMYVTIKTKVTQEEHTIKSAKLEMVWCLKCLWVLFSVSTAAAIMVTLLYWILIGDSLSYSSIQTHGVNTVFAVLHLLYTAKPIRIFHMYFVLIYAIVYTLFTLIYQNASGGHNIYAVLDWWGNTSGTLAYVFCIVLVASPGVYMLVFGIYFFREWIATKIGKTGQIRRSTSVRPASIEVSVKKSESALPVI